DAAEDAVMVAPPARSGLRRAGRWGVLALLAIVVAGLAFIWFSRERIVGNYLGSQLAKRNIHATYKIEQIGTRTQILRDVVVGNPRHPDLTIARAIVRINPRFGIPTVSRITLVHPRLHGTFDNGTLSFGELDPLLFRNKPKKQFELPDLDLAVEDGGALIETNFGTLGAKLTGRGNLQNGFAGELGAVSPRLTIAGCESVRTSLYGRLEVANRKPKFTGPVRFARLRCPGSGLLLRNVTAQVRFAADEALQKFDGDVRLAVGPSAFARGILASAEGNAKFTWRDQGLTADFGVTGRGVQIAKAAFSRVAVTGTLRTRRDFERVEVDGTVKGAGVHLGNGLDAALSAAARTGGDTLLAPVLAQIRRRLAGESRNSALAGEFTLRRTGHALALVVPNAGLRGGSGDMLLSLSRLQLSVRPGTALQISGGIATGGQGLPRIVGTVALGAGGQVQARVAMAEYHAAGSILAIPELFLVQRPSGALGFAGTIRASGKLPGGRADNLLLPVSGTWRDGRFELWPGCVPVTFDRLQYANLTLTRQNVTLCPSRGAAIVRYDGRGLRFAAGAPALRLTGLLGQTPIAIRSGPVGFSYPGALSARQIDVSLGPPANAQRFLISDLTARIGKDVSGRFSGTDVKLFSVPLDLFGASGNWRYAAGRLTLSDAAFRLEDRANPARFYPVIARGADLTLENNLVVAHALLREPKGDRPVTRADIRQDLASSRGHADLTVAGITFSRGFQPENLSDIARGRVALVRGTITGTGAIDWRPGSVTSTGRFSSDALDFAAAFGPVKGASGTVEFSDLLSLTTAPDQRIRVARFNPGIEVTDGEVSLQLKGGQVLAVQGGSWPFMGGTLKLRPVQITFGATEERRYVLEITGLDAARFLERMNLENLNATGMFDGTIPVVFDASGTGRIEGGVLNSRPPGGNVSYVGALTYKNMGAMANFAFQALRSLDYRQMRIEMNGNLTGEVVTKVRFDGVSQGAGAKQNYITRQIAKLPFRFDVNIRTSFYSLLTNLKSLYDPAAVKDPRSDAVGLLDAAGNPLSRSKNGVAQPPVKPENLIPDEAPIQHRESEK
ncbi:MAG: YdbH domain-containing protein, partial [Croceibacterium sp.]